MLSHYIVTVTCHAVHLHMVFHSFQMGSGLSKNKLHFNLVSVWGGGGRQRICVYVRSESNFWELVLS